MTKYLSQLEFIKIETILLEIKKILFINEMNDTINDWNPQKKFQNLIQFETNWQYYCLNLFYKFYYFSFDFSEFLNYRIFVRIVRGLSKQKSWNFREKPTAGYTRGADNT
jgi:hypothetical protein